VWKKHRSGGRSWRSSVLVSIVNEPTDSLVFLGAIEILSRSGCHHRSAVGRTSRTNATVWQQRIRSNHFPVGAEALEFSSQFWTRIIRHGLGLFSCISPSGIAGLEEMSSHGLRPGGVVWSLEQQTGLPMEGRPGSIPTDQTGGLAGRIALPLRAQSGSEPPSLDICRRPPEPGTSHVYLFTPDSSTCTRAVPSGETRRRSSNREIQEWRDLAVAHPKDGYVRIVFALLDDREIPLRPTRTRPFWHVLEVKPFNGRTPSAAARRGCIPRIAC